MEVIDNFLPSYQFKQLYNVLMSPEMTWFYNDGVSYEGDRSHQFVNLFVHWPKGTTPSYRVIEPFMPLFKIKNIRRIKVNLTTKTLFHRNTGWHTDNIPCSTSAIFYINTNNGWTKFKKGGKVKSVANRMVIFDSNLEHQGVTCTDKKRRVVMNFNYDV